MSTTLSTAAPSTMPKIALISVTMLQGVWDLLWIGEKLPMYARWQASTLVLHFSLMWIYILNVSHIQVSRHPGRLDLQSGEINVKFSQKYKIIFTKSQQAFFSWKKVWRTLRWNNLFDLKGNIMRHNFSYFLTLGEFLGSI